ncbi:MAG: TIGR01212 family radical SAM protein [Oscillospiraceae bacterium]
MRSTAALPSNRDGTIGARGLHFLCRGRFRRLAADRALDIPQQIEAAKARVAGKNGGGKYIAYFQNFTNTYGSLAHMERLFIQALAPEDVVALSVATRPDCLPDAVIALLQRLNTEKPVWVELGLQTIHSQSAAYIRRGYDLPVFDDAVRRLRAAGLGHCAPILRLSGETDAQMVQTARYIGQSGAQGIKLHLLHVLRGTDLAADYAAGKFEVLTPEHYIDLLEQCLRVLPPEVVIHRLTGDGAKRDLIAPLWSADKKRVLNAIRAAFALDDLVQGSEL